MTKPIADFTRQTNFNPEAEYSGIIFGAGVPLLEVELNEFQQILNHKHREVYKTYLGDGILATGEYKYINKNLSIKNEKAVVDGYVITIEEANIPANDNEEVYLVVSEKIVTGKDQILKHGCMSSTKNETVKNKIIDERVGYETTKRLQLQYNLYTKAKLPKEGSKLKLGSVKNNQFHIESPLLHTQENICKTDTFEVKGDQQVFKLEGYYKPNFSCLTIYVDGKFISPNKYDELDTQSFKFKTPIKAGSEVVAVYNLLQRSKEKFTNHSTIHSADGDDPVDISDLADRYNLIDEIKERLRMKEVDGGNFSDYFKSSSENFYDGGFF